jgi:hypothetical protein
MSLPVPGTVQRFGAPAKQKDIAPLRAETGGRADAMSWTIMEGSLTTSCRAGAGPRRTVSR